MLIITDESFCNRCFAFYLVNRLCGHFVTDICMILNFSPLETLKLHRVRISMPFLAVLKYSLSLFAIPEFTNPY